MNLHHFDTNGKNSFFKKLFSSAHNNNSGELQTKQNPESNPLENKLIRLFDRVGGAHLHDFTVGNICVFGDDEWEVESCSIQLLSRFASIGYEVRVIDADKVSPKNLQNPGAPLLIKISKQIPLKLMRDIIQACPSICLLKALLFAV